MQEDQAYSLYPMISRLLRHAQGQTLAEFWSPQATGDKNTTIDYNNITIFIKN